MRIEPKLTSPAIPAVEAVPEEPLLGIPPEIDMGAALEEPALETEKPEKLTKILLIASVVILLLAIGILIIPALDKELPSFLSPVVDIFRSSGGTP